MSTPTTLPTVLTESIGGSPLSLAVQRGDVEGIPPRPTGAAEWKSAAAAVRQRFAGDDWLERIRPAFGDSASVAALQRAAGRGILVTTGQQSGLFGGPMLTLVKALSARAYAEAIERLTGVPCATVFWAATDDADFVEAASVMIPGTGAPRKLSLDRSPPAGTRMSDARLQDVTELLDEMESCAGSIGSAPMAALRRAYREGATIGGAYIEFLRDVLTPWGIAVLDASHPTVAEASRPTLRDALVRGPAIEEAVGNVTTALRRRGFAPQVELVHGLSLVFGLESGIKRRIPLGEAPAVAASSMPLGPNVLLRPVVEAAILPTVAYAGGPGELAYFAQIPPIASVLGAAQPMALPRWSTTIVEEGIGRLLDRYGVSISDLRDYDVTLGRLIRERMPADLQQALTRLRDDIDGRVSGLAAAAAREGLDTKPLDGLRAQLALRVDRGERRISAALKHRDAELRRDLGTARASLYPDGIRQERALSFVPYLSRHGTALIERMLEEAGRDAVRVVGTAPEAVAPIAARR